MANFGGVAMAAKSEAESKALLNTCIHNYLVLEGQNDLAKAIRNSTLPTKQERLKKEQNNQANGAEDDKDKIHLDGDLALLDYWFIFWDMWTASKNPHGKPDSTTGAYLNLQMMQQQMMGNAMGNNNFGRFMQPGMNLQKNAVNNAQRNMAQFPRGPMAQQPMQREGSDMDGNQQRPQSPMSGGENAPSPSKRQRTDGNFNGQQMVGAVSMTNQMMNRGNPQALYSQGVASQTRNALTQFQNGYGVSGAAGAPTMFTADGQSFDGAMMGNQMRGNNGGSNGGALADYQMQLMLLEQQNKKRLMMARQETDVHLMGQQPGYPQNTSPQNRNGHSPNGNDTKRNTPKMGQNSPPSDGAMGARGSPVPGFDPSMHMGQGFAPQMTKIMSDGMIANMRPQTGQPISAQQMEMMQKNNLRAQNGAWNGQGQMAQAAPGQPQPDGQVQAQPQRGNMAPPQVPAAGAKAQSSPSQTTAAPPTPSQTNKPAPKTKKEAKDTKKKAPKKGATAPNATPNTESERPPTPTPQTPATPIGHDSHLIKGQPQQTQAQASVNGAMQQQPPIGPNSMEPFGNIEAQNDFSVGEFNFMDGATMGDDTADILGGFDFDTFLAEPTPWDQEFPMTGDGLESGAVP